MELIRRRWESFFFFLGGGGGSVNGATKKEIVVAVEDTRSLFLTKITSPERPNSVLGWKQSLDFLFVDLVWHGLEKYADHRRTRRRHDQMRLTLYNL